MDRRPTLADVAARAGVSTALVSIVMREAPGASAATRERVLAVADELGYRPDIRARLLRRSRSRLLGVVFGVQHAFHGDLVDGLYTAADRVGYELALSAVTPGRDEQRAVGSLLQDRCEALVLLGPQAPTAYLAGLAARLPVVVVARAVRHRAVDVVRTDDAAGLEQAVDHLVALGHRRIAHIDGGRAPGAAERRRGYTSALHRHGLGRNALIVPGGLTEDDGADAARALLELSDPREPTALTVFNDRCATGVLDVLRGAGVAVPAASERANQSTQRVFAKRRPSAARESDERGGVRRQPPGAPVARRPDHDRAGRRDDDGAGRRPGRRAPRRRSGGRAGAGGAAAAGGPRHHRPAVCRC